MFKGTEIGRSHREGTASPKRVKPEIKVFNRNDPDLKAFSRLPEDYQAFIIQKVQALGSDVSQNDRIAIVKYFLRKYEEFVRFSESAESHLSPPNFEQVKLTGELSSIAAEVDMWFKGLMEKYESGRQSAPHRIM
mgnify:CR=1 FL=1